MYDRNREIDLRCHLALGVEHIFNTLDERQEYLPFFHYELVQRPIYMKHGSFDSPHVVGRYLDALGRCSRIIELPDAPEVYAALARHLYASLNRHPSGLPWNTPTAWQPDVAVLHNCREAVLGLLALLNWQQDSKAQLALHRLCGSILKAVGTGSRFGGECLGSDGWINAMNGILASPPATTGRLIRPLVQTYRQTGDEAAFELVCRFVADNLETAFEQDGGITAAAGSHLHSITGTITGLIDFGLLTEDAVIIERARRAYDTGMAPFRSSYGWVKEFRFSPELAEPLRTAGYPGYDINRGEANNTADLVEAALLLGHAGYPGYFEDADRMLRNHLLASQLADSGWLQEEVGLKDTDEIRYSDVARRARGGFCFGSPSDFISYPAEPYQINADLAGGALQGICEAWEGIVAVTGDTARLNLLYSRSDEVLAVICPPPGIEPVRVRLHEPKRVEVRIPTWAKPGEVIFQAGNLEPRSAQDVIEDGYLKLPLLQPGSEIKLWLPERRETITEIISGERYQISWHNDTVVDIDPPARVHALYGRTSLS